MKKSKLAITSFVLSLIPIIVAIYLVILVLGPSTRIDSAGIQTTVQIVDSFSGLVGAFVLAFVYSLIMTFLLGITSITLGIIALVKIRSNGLGGKWFAISGIVISLLPAVFWIVYLVLNL